MTCKLWLMLAVGTCVVAGGLSTCQADWWWGFGRYQFHPDRRIPYFAEHPPVYYSFPPVPRSYGQSPFAYLPAQEPLVEPAPLIIPNPHVLPEPEEVPADRKPKREKRQPATAHSRPAPLVVINPYVTPSGSGAPHSAAVSASSTSRSR